MPETKGHLLPVYFVADESYSMHPCVRQLNDGLRALYDALAGEPMAAAKIRFSVLGFSDDVQVRVRLADMRYASGLPGLEPRGGTNYHAAFSDLLTRIPADVEELKQQNYHVHRPAVFFLSDGQPNRHGPAWQEPHARLLDRSAVPVAPNIISFGIWEADAHTILQVASKPELAFVSMDKLDVGSAVATFCVQLTQSVVASGSSLGGANPELRVDRPDGFALAIDLV